MTREERRWRFGPKSKPCKVACRKCPEPPTNKDCDYIDVLLICSHS